MGWTEKSYCAVLDFINTSRRRELRRILLADGLIKEAERLDNSIDFAVWYAITQEAELAVSRKTTEDSVEEVKLDKLVRLSKQDT